MNLFHIALWLSRSTHHPLLWLLSENVTLSYRSTNFLSIYATPHCIHPTALMIWELDRGPHSSSVDHHGTMTKRVLRLRETALHIPHRVKLSAQLEHFTPSSGTPAVNVTAKLELYWWRSQVSTNYRKQFFFSIKTKVIVCFFLLWDLTFESLAQQKTCL